MNLSSSSSPDLSKFRGEIKAQGFNMILLPIKAESSSPFTKLHQRRVLVLPPAQRVVEEMLLPFNKRKLNAPPGGIPKRRRTPRVEVVPESIVNIRNANPPEEIRQRVEELGGRELMLVADRTLTASDVNEKLARLQIPFSQIHNHDFVTEGEKATLAERVGQRGGPRAILVGFLDPNMVWLGLNFKRWDMSKGSAKPASSNYVWCTEWNTVVAANNLLEGQRVRVWSFRYRGDEARLGFALERCRN